MRNILIFVIACICLLPFSTICAEDERKLPKNMTEEKLKKSVVRQFNYIEKRLLSGKSADRILASNNSTAIDILNKGRETSAEIVTLIEKEEYKAAYFALQDLNKSLKVALKLSRAKDVAKKKAQDDVENARIISDAYYDRAVKLNINAGHGGSKATELFNLAVNLRTRAANQEKESKFAEAATLYNQATEKLKEAIALTSDRESFDLKFNLSELRKENDRRLKEAKEMSIDKGETGRDALIAYEHAMEKRAEGQDLLKSHDKESAASSFAESNKLFIRAIKYGKYYRSKNGTPPAQKKKTIEKETVPALLNYE